MKTISKICMVLLPLFAAVSCSLDENNTSYATADTYYKSYDECRTGVNGCYSPLRNIYSGHSFFCMTEVATDVMYYAYDGLYDAVCDISPVRAGIGKTVWQQGYMGIMRCNEMYECIERAFDDGLVTRSQADALIAEVVVLRAFYYYVLTCTFGDVPRYFERVTEQNRAEIVRLPRMSADETRSIIIDELKLWLMPATEEHPERKCALPLERTYDNDAHLVGSAVGLMLAGKMAMWNRQWEDVVEVYGVLEGIYGFGAGVDPEAALAQYPLSDVPFGKKYTRESIFELSNDARDYGQQVTGALAPWCTPAKSATGETDDGRKSDIYNGISIPELGDNARTYTSVRPTPYYYQDLMPRGSKDKRRAKYDESGAELDSSGNMAWSWWGYDIDDTAHENLKFKYFSTVNSAFTGTPWLGNKFWCFGMNNTRDSNNYKIFRYAGALLNLSEAYYEMGDYVKACQYLNAVRSRAGLDAIDSSDTRYLLSEIRNEYARELFGEYHRKFDLVRWGIWYEQTRNCTASTPLLTYIRPYKKFYPIPAEQVTYSGGALNNDDYNE